MNKLEKITNNSTSVSEEVLEKEEIKEEKKEKKFTSFFTFWKKLSDDVSEDGEILDPVEESDSGTKSIKSILNRKTTVLAACVVIIAIAGYINIRYSNPAENLPEINTFDETDTDIGTVLNESDGEEVQVETNEDYFALAVINRERVRDEAIEMLKDVTDSETTDVSAKNEAYADMTRMANEIASEANVESLVKAKGFEECVAVISSDNANIIVQTDGLSINEVAQIKEIVYLECGVLPDNIKIIEKANI